MNTPIHGTCDQPFARVREAFISNFEDLGQLGGRVAVIHEGRVVVDLWGGYKTEAKDAEWSADTLVCCMSVTKGVVALAAHLLAERGLLEYGAPVARYWPEFGAAGKEQITVREAMSHRASLAVIDAAQPGDVLDWDLFVSKIAAQPPNWPVATDETYHSVTIGYITGELVRRIDGRSIDQFIREELCEPLQADYVLGCGDEDLPRVVAHVHNPANELMNGGLINDTTAVQFQPFPADPDFMGSDDFLRLGFPSGGGVAHALGLATLFAPFAHGGAYNGVELYSPETIAAASEEQWRHVDSMFGNDFRVAVGLLLDNDFNFWGREGNVGTAGAGGYSAFADPENHLSFGFTPNRHTSGYGLGEEHKRLVEALYRCI